MLHRANIRKATRAGITVLGFSAFLLCLSAGARADDPKLLQLARKHFPAEDLKPGSPGEKFFLSVANGVTADYRVPGKRSDSNPANTANWGEERTLKVVWVEWLCKDLEASRLITSAGINIQGALIKDVIDLRFAQSKFPYRLSILSSGIKNDVLLDEAHFQSLDFSSSLVEGIFSANGAQIDDEVYLRSGFHVKGQVALYGIRIGGDLDCSGGPFDNQDSEIAIDAEESVVNGSVLLKSNFRATGGVELYGARIGGDFDCSGRLFDNPNNNDAIDAQESAITGSVLLNYGFVASHAIDFREAVIGGDFDCTNGLFLNPDGYAIDAELARSHRPPAKPGA